jgi:hypothetical protein
MRWVLREESNSFNCHVGAALEVGRHIDPEKDLDFDASQAPDTPKVLDYVGGQVIREIRFVGSHARSLQTLAVNDLEMGLIVERR